MLLGYAFSIGESIARQLKIYSGIQSSHATSLGPRASAVLPEKPELGSPMKERGRLIARTDTAGFATGNVLQQIYIHTATCKGKWSLSTAYCCNFDTDLYSQASSKPGENLRVVNCLNWTVWAETKVSEFRDMLVKILSDLCLRFPFLAGLRYASRMTLTLWGNGKCPQFYTQISLN